MQKKNTTRNRWLEQILFTIAVIILWQVIYYVGYQYLNWWKSYAMPNPVGVWESLITLIQKGTLLNAIGYSLARCFFGYILSVGVGLIIGVVITNISFLNRNLKPAILGLQTLPSICWVPFAILWFGLNESAIIFVVVMGSAFGIAIAVENSIRGVNPLYIKAALTMGVSKKQLYFRVILPASLPSLVSGLKQGWSFAWRALMSGEVMAASIGLGYTLNLGRDLADINQVMLIIIVIIVIGIVIEKLAFSVIEDRIYKKRGL